MAVQSKCSVLPLLYFVVSADESGKDKLLTKLYILFVSAMILTTLLFAYNFVYKQDDISLTNGHATLWDTGTEKLAVEICEDCDTDAEKQGKLYGFHHFHHIQNIFSPDNEYWITKIY